MKRSMVAVATVGMILWATAAQAGPAGTQQPEKKTAVGTIQQVDVKQQTITVLPAAGGQQVQVQTEPKKGKGQPEANLPLVFLVDEKTTIGTRMGDQNPAKGAPPVQAQVSKIQMLKPGLLVRVVYEEAAVKPDQKQEPKQKPDQKQRPKQKPAQKPDQKKPAVKKDDPKQKPEQAKPVQEAPAQAVPAPAVPEPAASEATSPAPAGKKGLPDLKQQPVKPLRAVSIEILAQAAVQTPQIPIGK